MDQEYIKSLSTKYKKCVIDKYEERCNKTNNSKCTNTEFSNSIKKIIDDECNNIINNIWHPIFK